MKVYTGVGSRQTPPQILDVMRRLAKKLASDGWTLRSGGAVGADQAFASGADAGEIYRASDATTESMELAKSVHPAWHRCSPYARRLHARNCFQVLGRNLKTPSRFLVCWTPGGAKIGGTSTAIRLAEKYGVAVFNLANPSHLDRIKKYID